MAHSKQALKRHRQSEEDRLRNKAGRSGIKRVQAKFQAAVAGKDAANATELYKRLCSSLDKAVKKGIIKKNQAVRKKGRAAGHLRAVKVA
ncbi:MAG: 30S ribosomal protein S20 [Kiritimatiellae bacterium]|nr:30S ribosomal protein S20 [Kiritimatiellia bacterium]MCO5068318.1 30S ribosomal protein S20 [Kiritimatiellia bacterium]